MKRTPTTSVSKLMSLFTLLERKNIDVKSFLSNEGLDADMAVYPDRRVPLDVVSRLNLRAAELTRDDFIGLHQGEVFTGFSNILGYVLMNCRDVAEAVEKYAKYQQILDEGRILLCRSDGETVIMQYMIDHPFLRYDRHLVEHIMAGMLTYRRNLTGIDLQCREVMFVHDAPDDISEYRRLFKCTPRFSSEKDQKVPIEEITYLLGFSEPSVFHRTFKRCTGLTPGTFRRQFMTGLYHAHESTK